MRTRPTALAWTVLVLAVSGPAGTAAQTVERTPEGLRLAGRVVDAASGDPVAGATVVVEPEALGAFPGSAVGSGFAAASRSARTDSVGRYRFAELAPGPYRLFAARYGYRPFTLTVELRQSSAGLSVALEADPIALEPVRGRSVGRGPYVAADPFGPSSDLELARLLVADLRRNRFLSTDVRELTHADVVESVTLGEPDLFRALQRLPGVTTRSDYTAALWTRGAPWSQTRVYYDGVPLFNPLHALGMISGIGSGAIGTVWFHPGVRSAGIGSGAAGIVDLRSRPAGGVGEMNVRADASLATAGLALDQRVLDGRAGWMLSGRTSYLDWLTDLARRAASREDDAFPYRFSEVAGRLDAQVGQDHRVEASWLWEGDALSSAGDTASDPLRATWGNALARATWSAGLGDHRVQHTVGWSRHHGLVRSDPATDLQSPDAVRRSETTVDYLVLRGALWPDDGSVDGPRWSLGYEITRHGVRYLGPIPLPVPRATALNAVAPDAFPIGEAGDSLDLGQWTTWDSSLPVVALWGERSWDPGASVTLRAGLRAETGAAIRSAAGVRLAPRLSVRYEPIPELALSAGAARVWQYAQTVAPGGGQLASLVSTDAWLLAGDGVHAI
ncbi:MAG: carboxypeptidase regulatory-like domain-containing protein, partial [Gemmatimonadota bacterium]